MILLLLCSSEMYYLHVKFTFILFSLAHSNSGRVTGTLVLVNIKSGTKITWWGLVIR